MLADGLRVGALYTSLTTNSTFSPTIRRFISEELLHGQPYATLTTHPAATAGPPRWRLFDPRPIYPKVYNPSFPKLHSVLPKDTTLQFLCRLGSNFVDDGEGTGPRSALRVHTSVYPDEAEEGLEEVAPASSIP